MDNNGRCPIHMAAMKRNNDILQIITTTVPDCIDIRCRDGKCILHYAIKSSSLQALSWIGTQQIYKFQGDERDKNEDQPLHLCSNEEIIDLLLTSYPNLNITNMNKQGVTPMEVISSSSNVSDSLKEKIGLKSTLRGGEDTISKAFKNKGNMEVNAVIVGVIASVAASLQYSSSNNTSLPDVPGGHILRAMFHSLVKMQVSREWCLEHFATSHL